MLSGTVRRGGLGLMSSAAGLGLVLQLGGCASGPEPWVGSIYADEAQADDTQREPVIVIPGILGSRLVDTESGQLVWGAFAGDYARPDRAEEARRIAHPMREGAALREIRDGVRDDGALDRVKVKFFGIPVSLSAYFEILSALGVGGYYDRDLAESGLVPGYTGDHFTCDQFAYDWRRDISESAAQLADLVEAQVAYTSDLRGGGPVKVDLVAHSMGGLVARYYLRYGRQALPEDGSLPELTWEGARHVRQLIMVGTPNAGSAEAIVQLVNGFKVAPLLPSYGPSLLGTMPSIYQLMPRSRHRPLVSEATGEPIDRLYDPEYWIEMGWGLADPGQADELRDLLPEEPDDAARRRVALDHLRKCLRRAEQFHRALDVPARPPEGLRITMIAGDVQPTLRTVGVNDLGVIRKRGRDAGDGTVLRSSTLMDERLDGEWTTKLRSPIGFTDVIFLPLDHIGLTKDPAFADNVLYRLLVDPPGRESGS